MIIRPITCSLATLLAALGVIASAPAIAASASGAEGAAYPNRPIRFIVGSPPGGTSDILARLISQPLSEILKQQVVVDNRPGAAGVVGAELTARAVPDGYTIFLAYHSHTTNATLNPKVPYCTVDDFQPITLGITAGLMLVVHPSVPVRSVQELIAYAKANPDKLSFSSAGNGSGGHMAGEMFKMMAGIRAQHVPYKGTGPSLIDLVGGQIQLSFAGMVPVQPFVRGGRLRALAVTTAQRIAVFPDMPTVAESGVPGFEATGWHGVLAPAGLPKPVLGRLRAEIVRILRSPDAKERLARDGSEVVASTPQEFEKFLRADVEKWARVVKATGARLD